MKNFSIGKLGFIRGRAVSSEQCWVLQVAKAMDIIWVVINCPLESLAPNLLWEDFRVVLT
jgi:hypothetical protein